MDFQDESKGINDTISKLLGLTEGDILADKSSLLYSEKTPEGRRKSYRKSKTITLKDKVKKLEEDRSNADKLAEEELKKARDKKTENTSDKSPKSSRISFSKDTESNQDSNKNNSLINSILKKNDAKSVKNENLEEEKNISETKEDDQEINEENSKPENNLSPLPNNINENTVQEKAEIEKKEEKVEETQDIPQHKEEKKEELPKIEEKKEESIEETKEELPKTEEKKEENVKEEPSKIETKKLELLEEKIVWRENEEENASHQTPEKNKDINNSLPEQNQKENEEKKEISKEKEITIKEESIKEVEEHKEKEQNENEKESSPQKISNEESKIKIEELVREPTPEKIKEPEILLTDINLLKKKKIEYHKISKLNSNTITASGRKNRCIPLSLNKNFNTIKPDSRNHKLNMTQRVTPTKEIKTSRKSPIHIPKLNIKKHYKNLSMDTTPNISSAVQTSVRNRKYDPYQKDRIFMRKFHRDNLSLNKTVEKNDLSVSKKKCNTIKTDRNYSTSVNVSKICTRIHSKKKDHDNKSSSVRKETRGSTEKPKANLNTRIVLGKITKDFYQRQESYEKKRKLKQQKLREELRKKKEEEIMKGVKPLPKYNKEEFEQKMHEFKEWEEKKKEKIEMMKREKEQKELEGMKTARKRARPLTKHEIYENSNRLYKEEPQRKKKKKIIPNLRTSLRSSEASGKKGE